MTRRIAFAPAPLALLALCAALYAQQDSRPGWDDNPQPLPDRDGIATLHTGVQLVVQDITVTDAKGKPVVGLKPEDFHIFEDGRPQTATPRPTASARWRFPSTGSRRQKNDGCFLR